MNLIPEIVDKICHIVEYLYPFRDELRNIRSYGIELKQLLLLFRRYRAICPVTQRSACHYTNFGQK